MSWPKDLSRVACINFTPRILPIIRNAIDGDEVKWGTPTMLATTCSAPFRWMGCSWEIYEVQEMVQSISLTEGKPDSEDLTAALLRG